MSTQSESDGIRHEGRCNDTEALQPRVVSGLILRHWTAKLTIEKKMKKSSQPKFFAICPRANSLRPTVAMAMPVKTQPMTLISTPRLSLKSTSVLKDAIVCFDRAITRHPSECVF